MTPEQKQRIRFALEHKPNEGCILCGNMRIACRALFVPTTSFSQRMGAPAGKERVVIYDLCHGCFAKENKQLLVEQKLLADSQVQ